MKHEKKNNYVVINNSNSIDITKMNTGEENIVILDYTKTINDLYKSFNNSKKEIYKQFKNDFPRCYYIINNNIETNINTFINYFEFSQYEYKIKPYIIFMLSNQAIMGIALQLLYNNLKLPNVYIGELKKKSNLVFMFYSSKEGLYLKINKILRIFTITKKNNKDITLKKININIFISLNEMDKIIITYKILKK